MAYGMGLTAEIVADKYGITREQQQDYALESHRRAIAAQDDKLFQDEIVPVTIKQSWPDLASGDIQQRKVTVTEDQGPRRDSTSKQLDRLPSGF